MSYQIRTHRLFVKEQKKLPQNVQKRISAFVISLQNSPRINLPNINPLQGHIGVYRFRIGNYRLIYHLDHKSQLITLIGVSSRGNIYQLFKHLST